MLGYLGAMRTAGGASVHSCIAAILSQMFRVWKCLILISHPWKVNCASAERLLPQVGE
jgi:hypothetical protein